MRIKTHAVDRLAAAALALSFNLTATAPATASATKASRARTAAQREGRLAPPPHLPCSRDETTSFTGRVISYSRSRGRVLIRVRTDEETTEQFTLKPAARSDLKALFLLRGAPFKQSDWKLIEGRAGRLRPNMRATVWACYEEGEPSAKLIDWLPPEA